jgi:replicative DNA helicase
LDNLYNLSVERAVLSLIIFDPSTFEEIAALLKPEDFYLPFHQHLFKAMEELSKNDEPIDEEFLRQRLEKEGKFDEVAMLEVLSANPITDTTSYIKLIKALSSKRALIGLATEIKKLTIEEDLDATEVMDRVEKKLYEITQDSTAEDFRESKEIAISMLEEIKRIKALGNTGLIGVDTGFKNLNEKTSGFGKGDLIIIAARPAMGKCLGKGTKVLMYSGELKKVEDIKVGDLLMGDDSTPRRVLSVTKGVEEMYWVRQNKGIDYRVNKSHILSLKRSRTDGKHKHGDILNISVEEYIKKSNKFKSNYKGYKVAVEFKEQKLEIEPYFLGIWLGDGSITNAHITNTDKEISDYLYKLAKKLKIDIKESFLNKNPKHKRFKLHLDLDGNKSILEKSLKDLNLINNKHIPKKYLINSRKNRLELLAGLIDSDGYYDDKHHVFEITQKSKELAKQIKFLADSLGFRVSLKSKKARIKSRNYECEVYRVRIVGNLDEIPTKVKRKQARALKSNRDHTHTGIKVEFDKVDEYYGFEIDGNRLFLLEDMTVTHNTALVLNIALKAIERGEGVAFFSLEMPAEQLMLRMLSIKTSIPLQALRVGNLDDIQWSQLSSAIDEVSSQKLFVDDGGYATIHHVRSKLRKLKAKHPEISMAIIDYLQLMSGDRGREGRQQEISEISRGLKQLARELEIPIIALSQLNRSLESRENKRPMLSDLRESGCLAGDSLIIDAKSGREYTIEEIVRRKDELLPMRAKAMSNNLKIQDFNIVNAFYSGEKITYKLKTKSGYTIRATANHKFYKVEGWIRLDKLKIGDKIAIAQKMDIDIERSYLVDDELILLAHLLGDGCILQNNQPYHYTSKDMENIDIVKKTAKNLFNIEGRVVKQKNWWHLYLSSPYSLGRGKKHPITLWYERLNIKRSYSYDKEIPTAVFESNKSGIKLFLHHLWSTDGSITFRKYSDRFKVRIYYSTSSKKFAYQLKSLLVRLGIISTIKKVKQIKKGKKYRDNYHVIIQGKYNSLLFLEQVGCFGKRGEIIKDIIEYFKGIRANPNNGCIDKSVWKTIIKDAKEKEGISWREFSKKIGISYCGNNLFKNGISKDRMKKISSFIKNQQIEELAYSDIYWDEIVLIKESKYEKTYDLTVDEVHNFVANGIVVHNSIEQDADIVMFVYRDSVYREAKEKEKEMKAKAEGKEYVSTFRVKPEDETELIIGKQRNGPTGTVDLIFQKRFTRFIDAPKKSEGPEIIYENIDTKEAKFDPPSSDDNYDFPTNL